VGVLLYVIQILILFKLKPIGNITTLDTNEAVYYNIYYICVMRIKFGNKTQKNKHTDKVAHGNKSLCKCRI